MTGSVGRVWGENNETQVDPQETSCRTPQRTLHLERSIEPLEVQVHTLVGVGRVSVP